MERSKVDEDACARVCGHHAPVPDTQPSPAELRSALVEVIDRGAPAQREHAERLLDRLAVGVSDDTVQECMLLIDAFRNDPYLWR